MIRADADLACSLYGRQEVSSVDTGFGSEQYTSRCLLCSQPGLLAGPLQQSLSSCALQVPNQASPR